MATTIEITVPALHPGQMSVLRSIRRFNCLVAGRRWGKNVLATHLLVEPALQGYPVALFSPGFTSC